MIISHYILLQITVIVIIHFKLLYLTLFGLLLNKSYKIGLIIIKINELVIKDPKLLFKIINDIIYLVKSTNLFT